MSFAFRFLALSMAMVSWFLEGWYVRLTWKTRGKKES